MILVNTADGSRITVAHQDGNLGEGASLDPSGRFVYMAPYAGDEQIRSLYRMPVAGGEVERIADGWEANLARMTWSLDGRWLAISGSKGSEVVHRVLDTRDGTLTAHRGSGIGTPIGFLGDELVGYLARGDGGITRYPLLALDVTTGKVRTLVDGDGGALGVVLPDAHGSPVLAYDVPDEDGRYTVRITDRSGASRPLHSSEERWQDAIFGEGETSALVGTGLEGGVESPGFAPVFTGGIPYAWPGGPDYEHPTRTMVGLATGEATMFEQRGSSGETPTTHTFPREVIRISDGSQTRSLGSSARTKVRPGAAGVPGCLTARRCRPHASSALTGLSTSRRRAREVPSHASIRRRARPASGPPAASPRSPRTELSRSSWMGSPPRSRARGRSRRSWDHRVSRSMPRVTCI